jgi:hypothetical protein
MNGVPVLTIKTKVSRKDFRIWLWSKYIGLNQMCSMWGCIWAAILCPLYTLVSLLPPKMERSGPGGHLFLLSCFVSFLFDAEKKGPRSRISWPKSKCKKISLLNTSILFGAHIIEGFGMGDLVLPNPRGFVGLAYQCKDIVFRFIIEYSSLMDFGP